MSGTASKCNLAKPPLSTIRTFCYPHLFKVNTKAIKHGCKYEDIAIKAYAEMMSTKHVNFKVEKCVLFNNALHPFLHASSDFLSSCHCCGLGAGRSNVQYLSKTVILISMPLRSPLAWKR